MRYDDLLHELFITSVNGILANPANMNITQEQVVSLAWGVAVTGAGHANNFSTLIPKVFTNLPIGAEPADPLVSTSVAQGTKLNNPTTSEVKTLKPTTVTNTDGEYIEGSTRR